MLGAQCVHGAVMDKSKRVNLQIGNVEINADMALGKSSVPAGPLARDAMFQVL